MKRSLAGRVKAFASGRFTYDRRGVAAVEFAIVLPVMLTMYLGCAELSQGLEVARKATTATSSLTDLISEQASGVNLTDSEATDAFNATSVILSPYSTSPLKLTLSSVEFVTDGQSATGFDAKVRWTITYNGGTARPCQAMTSVANNATPSPTTLPTGIYPPAGAAQATMIVADSIYTYTPTFGPSLLAWSGKATNMVFRHAGYMRPRNEYKVVYAGGTGTNCPSY